MRSAPARLIAVSDSSAAVRSSSQPALAAALREKKGPVSRGDLADVERLCRRIVLIDEGKLVYDGPVERLKEQFGTHRTLVVTLGEPHASVSVAGAESVSVEGVVARLRFDRSAVSAEQLIRRVTEAYAVTDLSIEEPDLESVIRRIYLEGYDAPRPAPAGAAEPVT